MKKVKKTKLKVTVACFGLGVCLMFPAIVHGESGLVEIQKNAEVNYQFDASNRYFDGTRVIDKTADLSKISSLKEGTIIFRAKFEGKPDATSMYSIFGLGNEAGKADEQVVLGTALNPFAVRYELPGGLKSSAVRSKTFNDNQWHTVAFTAQNDYVSVSVDGISGTTGTDGFYQAEKWKGFLSRGANLNSFMLGGFTSKSNNSYTYKNWIGEIDYVTITSQVVTPLEADQLTAPVAEKIKLNLSNTVVKTPGVAGSLVGELSAEGQSLSTSLVEGAADNHLFTLENNQLVTKNPLEPYSTYQVFVKSGNELVDESRFTITTLGDNSGQLLKIAEKTTIESPISYPDLVQKTSDLKDITIKAKFIQSTTGIGSLVSFSNQNAGNEHFHLYANGSSIGYELRGLKNSSDISSSAASIRSNGLNTIAFKASSEENTFKIFANGKLVNTKQLTESSYRMIEDMVNGINAVTVGATPRSGNNYPFKGTVLDLEVTGSALTDDELLTYTKVTPNEGDDTINSPHIFEASGSNYFRIPALYTLNDGTVMAAIDARFGGAADSPNNLDTTINFLDKDKNQWGEATLPLHFVDYTDEPGYVGSSASYIDPVIVQDTQDKIYMGIDAFPAGYGYPNAKTGSGMKTVDGKKYLGLTKYGSDVTNWNNFTYYVKDGVIYDGQNVATEYTMDESFNLSKNGEALYVDQKRPNGSLSGKKVPMSVFYQNSDFKVFATSFLLMTTSTDNGKTWSEPENLNGLKREEDRFWGTGPGRGHRIEKGEFAGRVVIPTYDSENGERVSTIYTDDHGKTWQRGQRTTMAATNSPGKASESQLIELPDGTLRLFARGNTGYIGFGDSHDGGVTFEPMEQDKGLGYAGNVMISVINYQGKIDGKDALILSAPEGSGRNNGVIRIGLINEPTTPSGQHTIDWKYKYSVNKGGFVYSCLTQLPNGKIALLWENDPNTKPAMYTEYTLEELINGKSQLKHFGVQNESQLAPGQEIKVSFQPTSQIVPELSELATSELEVTYPNTTLTSNALAFDTYDEATNTLIYKGMLPESIESFSYDITPKATNKIFTLAGSYTASKLDRISGEVEVEIIEDVPVSGIKLDVSALTILKVGKKQSLIPVVSPENATDKKLTWIIEKPEIATISDNNELMAKKAGTTKITARSSNGLEESFVLRVTK